mmetsp:Transcript_39695/g.119275  ORF Transcript_39695/g.119275 Transcript_39695/m.119275 type:complete len:303 (-) Transcript_39695:736-1644(-)
MVGSALAPMASTSNAEARTFPCDLDAIVHSSPNTSEGIRSFFTSRAIASSIDARSLTVASPTSTNRLSATSFLGSSSAPSVPGTATNTSTNALRTSSWMLCSVLHMSANACFIPVTALGSWKCLARTKNRRASVTSDELDDSSIPSKAELASSNNAMNSRADEANLRALTLAWNSASSSDRSSGPSPAVSDSAMAAARAAASISSLAMPSLSSSFSRSCCCASRAAPMLEGMLLLKYCSISLTFSTYGTGSRLPMNGLFSRRRVRSCIAALLTITALSCNLPMARAVTGSTLSRGNASASVM